jgi:hypothetical protein
MKSFQDLQIGGQSTVPHCGRDHCHRVCCYSGHRWLRLPCLYATLLFISIHGFFLDSGQHLDHGA